MKIKYLLPALLIALPVSVTRAQGLKMLDDLSYYLRMDYSLGGTAPVGLPATIRRLDSYSLRPNFSIGIEAQKPLDDRWAVGADVSWGLSSVFHSDFKTIEQRLYSIFGTVGVVYHLK